MVAEAPAGEVDEGGREGAVVLEGGGGAGGEGRGAGALREAEAEGEGGAVAEGDVEGAEDEDGRGVEEHGVDLRQLVVGDGGGVGAVGRDEDGGEIGREHV